MDMNTPAPQQTIRLSLRWILLGMLIITMLGVAGGYLGQQLFGNNGPLIIPQDGRDQLITTVQEITISPNKATLSSLNEVERSLATLGTLTNAGEFVPIGTGLVMTNDGLLVTTIPASRTGVVAFMSNQAISEATLVGEDTLYGLTYFKFKDAVSVPVALSDETPAVGTSLLAFSRAKDTLTRAVSPFIVNEHSLPATDSVMGIQKYLTSASFSENTFYEGSPLVTEDSKVAGIITDASSGKAISSDILRASLSRITANTSTLNPFSSLGIVPKYQFSTVGTGRAARFVVAVTGVTPNSIASKAGLRAGDQIIRIGDQELTWDVAVPALLEPSSVTLTVIRQNKETQVPLVR